MNAKTLEVMYRGWRGVFTGDTQTCPQCNGTGHMEWAAGVNGNCTRCLGFGVIEVEHSPADVIVVTGETLPDEIAAILALTPHAAEDTPWAEREKLAAAVSEAGAAGLVESWGWCFAEKPLNMDANGDVWA